MALEVLQKVQINEKSEHHVQPFREKSSMLIRVKPTFLPSFFFSSFLPKINTVGHSYAVPSKVNGSCLSSLAGRGQEESIVDIEEQKHNKSQKSGRVYKYQNHFKGD